MKRHFIILAVIIFYSCEKFFMEDPTENNHINNFDLLWQVIDEKYSFFTYKNINWDSIYNVYRPKVNNDLSVQEFFDVMAGMLNELRDGHVNLYSNFAHSANFDWHLGHRANFNLENIHNNYLVSNFFSAGPFLVSEIDSVGYVYIPSFADEFRESDLDSVVEHLYGLKGIIFDVRNNSGGLNRTGRLIAGRFADSVRLVSYTLYKTGPGHDDFSKPQPNYIGPHGKKRFLKPVVVLSNRRSYSATNDFVMNMAAFPHVTVIGDQTGGGGGTPYDYELLNGWRCRFPRTMTLAANGFNIEHGINPDIRVNISRTDELRGIDTIIEAALVFLSSRSLKTHIQSENLQDY